MAWGVVLGGGGARTFAHLGVLCALEAAGHRPAFVTGGSLGAVLGALYAMQPADAPDPAARATAVALDYFARHRDFGGARRPRRGTGLHVRSGFFGRMAKGLATFAVAGATAFRPGLRKRHPVYAVVDDWFGDRTVESLRVPFACVALDLGDADVRVFDRGPLAPALKAGMAVGFVFAPFAHAGRRYADAAPTVPVPVSACRALGATHVLALDVSAPTGTDAPLDTGLDVVMRIIAAGSRRMNDAELSRADAVVRPPVEDVFWGDFSRCAELVDRGRAAAEHFAPAWLSV